MERLDRTFEAIVFGWDGTAVRDRRASATAVRRRLEALAAHGVDLAVLSGTFVHALDGQLQARPDGPGRLFLALNRGSELYLVSGEGEPRLLWRRHASKAEVAALDDAAALTIERLTTLGVRAEIVSPRLNRRRIAVSEMGQAVVELATWAAKEAGLADPRVLIDGLHVEIGLTDLSDANRLLINHFAERGIGPGMTLVVGDQLGPQHGLARADVDLLLPEAARVTLVSVGAEPQGVPAGVRHLPGGPIAFRDLLDEQLRRRARGRVPAIDEDPEWVLARGDGDPVLLRRDETLLTLSDGVIGIRGSHESPLPDELPLVTAAGVYTGQGPEQHLLPGPSPLHLNLDLDVAHERRLLDLHTGVLLREGTDGVRTLRFVAAGHRGVIALRAEGPAGRVPADSSPLAVPGPDGWHDSGERARTTGDRGGIAAVAHQEVGRDNGLRTVERLAAYASEALRPPSMGRASTLLDRVKGSGFERLLADHRRTWVRRWDDACVWIPDDLEVQLAARFAMFHLWGSAAPRGEAAVGARGLSGTGYNGHVFWDADVYVLPALASMAPAAARAMLEYRLRRLPQAIANAARHGSDGARFPWESATEGEDVTPQSGRANGEWVPIFTGELEEHVVADVAWAAWQYAHWSGDEPFLLGPGRALLTETARYWASRVQQDEQGRGHIRHVIGPDEYHEGVDDDVYTNVLARWNLRRGAELTTSAAERTAWAKLADSLVDGYQPVSGRHEQFTGYDGLEPLVVADIGTPPLAADLLLGRPRTLAAQIVKQPDVLMAHHVVPEEMQAGSLEADLDFYLPRTSHGSTLSPAVTAAVLARAGRPDSALRLLDIALRIDLDDLTGMTASGLHAATLGGVWQAFLVGFAGARVGEAGVLSLDPQLPARWGSLRLRFLFRGRRVDLLMNHDVAHVVVSGPLVVRTPGCAPIEVERSARLVRTDTGWVVHP